MIECKKINMCDKYLCMSLKAKQSNWVPLLEQLMGTRILMKSFTSTYPSSIYIEPFPSISSKCQHPHMFYKLTILIWIALRRRLRTCKWDPFTLASWAISMAVLPSPLPSSGSAPSSSNMRKVSSSPETQTLSKRRCRQYWWFVDVSPFTRGYFQVPS